jgi:hypothetical protein
VIRRYENQNPGDLVHLDIKKFGRIPEGVDTVSLASPPATGTRRHGWAAGGNFWLICYPP